MKTGFATGDALTKKIWEEDLFRDMIIQPYFARFMGKDKNSLVYVKEDLVAKKGDRITFGIRMRLTESGVEDGETLEGKEEKLSTFSHTITLKRYRHGVRDDGDLSRQRVTFSIDGESQDALVDWGVEKIDALCFAAVEASPTAIVYGGVATGTGDMLATDLITPARISELKAKSKTGFRRAQPPLRPIMVDGKKYYIMLLSTSTAYDLKQDSTWTQTHREASLRGLTNPIFSGALGVWDGVVIHEHESVGEASNWGVGANVNGAKNSFLGAQALCFAWGRRPKVVYKTFDYDEEHGFAWSVTARTNKPVFNSLDYGSVAFYCAHTNKAAA